MLKRVYYLTEKVDEEGKVVKSEPADATEEDKMRWEFDPALKEAEMIPEYTTRVGIMHDMFSVQFDSVSEEGKPFNNYAIIAVVEDEATGMLHEISINDIECISNYNYNENGNN